MFRARKHKEVALVHAVQAGSGAVAMYGTSRRDLKRQGGRITPRHCQRTLYIRVTLCSQRVICDQREAWNEDDCPDDQALATVSAYQLIE